MSEQIQQINDRTGSSEEQEEVLFGHPRAWSRELKIPIHTLVRRMHGAQGITGILDDGSILINGFFAECDIRERCRDLLDPNMKQVDTGGSFRLYKRVCRHRRDILKMAQELAGVPMDLFEERLDNVGGYTAIDEEGWVREGEYFSETVAKKIYNDLQGLPRAEGEGKWKGFFTYLDESGKREIYGTKNAWAFHLGVSGRTMRKKLERIKTDQGMMGVDVNGITQIFYPESLIYSHLEERQRRADEPLRPDYITAEDEHGNNAVYGTSNSIARDYNISGKRVRNKKHELHTHTRQDANGNTLTYYPVTAFEHRGKRSTHSPENKHES